MLYIKNLIWSIQRRKSLSTEDIFSEITNKQGELIIAEFSKKLIKLDASLKV